jgi:hypothetical protein
MDSEKIIKKYKAKGLDVDRFYGIKDLADLKIIPTKRGKFACHQAIRILARKNEIQSHIEARKPEYKIRTIKGMWVLDYLYRKGLL